MSLGKKPNTWGIKKRPRGMGPDIDEADFVKRAKQPQMEFNNKRSKPTIENKTKVTLFSPLRVVTCVVVLDDLLAFVPEGR
jgi:hypothetical protein